MRETRGEVPGTQRAVEGEARRLRDWEERKRTSEARGFPFYRREKTTAYAQMAETQIVLIPTLIFIDRFRTPSNGVNAALYQDDSTKIL